MPEAKAGCLVLKPVEPHALPPATRPPVQPEAADRYEIDSREVRSDSHDLGHELACLPLGDLQRTFQRLLALPQLSLNPPSGGMVR